MELLGELDKLPGQEIVAEALTNVIFSIPPALTPPANFLKPKNAGSCASGNRVTMPELPNPFEALAKLKDPMRSVMNLAQEKIEQLIAQTIINLMSKALEVLTMASSLTDQLSSIDNLSEMAESAIQGA